MNDVEIKHMHLFCGIGGGAAGFNDAQARVGSLNGIYRCIGGIDSDDGAIESFNRISGARGTCMDLFSHDQYVAWHGHEPPEEWREMLPEDIRRAAGNERPNIVFTSSPCKGFSGLLSSTKSGTQKYMALNDLTLRGVWLTLEAWNDDPPEFILFENVPLIQSRGRYLLDQITALLRKYGYAVAETTHDCGEIGGLAQSRRRFLLVARHEEKVPPFLYEPPKKRLRGVGEVIGSLPMPGNPLAGPMHRLPNLQWKTWARLAFVEAGKDWRSLQRLNVENGMLTDYGIVPEGAFQGASQIFDPRIPDREYGGGPHGVLPWDRHSGALTGKSGQSNGFFSVADPRFNQSSKWHDGQAYGVLNWDEPAGTIAGKNNPGQGKYAVPDPRIHSHLAASGNRYRIVELDKARNDTFAQSGGHYGVAGWEDTSYTVTGKVIHDRGNWSLADPRLDTASDGAPALALPEQKQNGVFVIESLDGTWHRPFTTLELAALQGFVDADEFAKNGFSLAGASDSRHREWIGNAVPRKAAAAIAGVMGQTLLLAMSGTTFTLSSMPIWVQPFATALSVDIRQGTDDIIYGSNS